MEAHRVVRSRVVRMFYTIGSQKAMKLSTLCAGRPLLPRNIPGTYHYATNRKVAGSSSDVVDFSQFTESFQPHYGPRVNSASNRNEYQESSWG
jgi:hypothetical protein